MALDKTKKDNVNSLVKLTNFLNKICFIQIKRLCFFLPR
jgi:hypothetical protein